MSAEQDSNLAPTVIYKDEGILILSKPAGLLVHAAKINLKTNARQESTLVDWLKREYPEVTAVGDDPEIRPGLVHRLDKGTSGIMIVARAQPEFDYFKDLFKARKIKKTYLALGWGHASKDGGEIAMPIGIKSGSIKRSVHSSKMAKSAETDYEVMDRATAGEIKTSLFKVRPRTGRTHQIRVHLAYLGHPIVGDNLYGPRRPVLAAPRLMLHALSLEFERRPGERLLLEASPDLDFSEFLKICGYPQ